MAQSPATSRGRRPRPVPSFKGAAATHKALAACAAIALVCAGCATQPQGPGPGRHGGRGYAQRGGPPGAHGGGPGRIQLFISPSGEPFRAKAGEPYPVAAWFARADRNGDGRVTLDEFRADADQFFARLDADGDGSISMTEVATYETDIAPEITAVGVPASAGGEPTGWPQGEGGGGSRSGGGRGRGGGHRGGGGSGSSGDGNDGGAQATVRGGGWQGAAMFSLIDEPEPIRVADSDFSMTVTRAEWRAATDRRYKLLDRDGDGVLTLAELPLTPVQERRARRPR
jgi:Ca2+-binding EF-hand superfamily protein